MDPSHLSLLEMAAIALKQAVALPAGDAGVFVGISGLNLGVPLPNPTPHILKSCSIISTALSTAAGRISYLHGLSGPSLVVDTACSSTLVAIDLAVGWVCASNHQAIASGSNLLWEASSDALTVAGFLSNFG